MKASIGDVALKAGVSNARVSRTFAHPEQGSEGTRLKVFPDRQQFFNPLDPIA